jgi:hypothetical protein
MKTIEIVVAPDGKLRLETKGFQGAGCRTASQFLERALGRTTADEVTPEFHQQAVDQQAQAQAGPCTAHGTVYTASIAAGLMLYQCTRWLRGVPVEADVTLNLLAGELIAAA